MKKPIDLKLTPEGFKKLIDEEQQLRGGRPSVLKRMVEAREQGDLSENAGYHAAKEQLGYIDSRLRQLKLMIRFANVVKSSGRDYVSFGNIVTVKIGKDVRIFTVVSAQEADPSQGKISEVSPIGLALLGKVVGDKVVVETDDANTIFEILDIKI